MKTHICFSHMVASTRDFQRAPLPILILQLLGFLCSIVLDVFQDLLPKFVKVSSFRTPFSSNAVNSHARRVFKARTIHSKSHFCRLPKKLTQFPKTNDTNSSSTDFENMLSELMKLYQDTRHIESPVVSKCSNISNQLHRSFKSISLLWEVHDQRLKLQLSHLPTCWHQQSLYYYQKAYTTLKSEAFIILYILGSAYSINLA